MNYTITSADNFTISIDTNQENYSYLNNNIITLSIENAKHYTLVESFKYLLANWDTYNANTPSKNAISKALKFILELSKMNLDVYYTVPTADGDIIVELKKNNANLEFIFSEQVDDKVIATFGNDFNSEAELNETTFNAYLKWLFTNGESI